MNDKRGWTIVILLLINLIILISAFGSGLTKGFKQSFFYLFLALNLLAFVPGINLIILLIVIVTTVYNLIMFGLPLINRLSTAIQNTTGATPSTPTTPTAPIVNTAVVPNVTTQTNTFI
jgi:hypothetical protein